MTTRPAQPVPDVLDLLADQLAERVAARLARLTPATPKGQAAAPAPAGDDAEIDDPGLTGHVLPSTTDVNRLHPLNRVSKTAWNHENRQRMRAVERLYRSDFAMMVPNIRLIDWGEADLWGVRYESRLGVEFEFKHTFADFRLDAKKTVKNAKTGELRNKHEVLAQEGGDGPSQFYFVVPEHIAQRTEAALPAWAGLVVLYPDPGRPGRWQAFPMKAAPYRHERMVSTEDELNGHIRLTRKYWVHQDQNDFMSGLAQSDEREP